MRRQKMWFFGPSKQPKPKVPDALKSEVKAKADKLVESVLKPTHIKPPPDKDFNYIVDIYTKWYRSYFYFCARYRSPSPNAVSPFLEFKFARMEYAGHDRFNLSYMRHTGTWWELYSELTMDECFAAIANKPHFLP